VVAAGRKAAVGYKPDIGELNRDWAIISRVIVHPKYRTTGLGHRLVRETLPLCGRRHVELIAVMAQYNPFAERAGMRLVLKQEPDRTIVDAVENMRALGFNPAMMASETYNLKRLEELSEGDVEQIKEVLLGIGSTYYKRLMSSSRPYVKKDKFTEFIRVQPPERLARCLKVLSVLNETKAYLYWCRDWLEQKEDG